MNIPLSICEKLLLLTTLEVKAKMVEKEDFFWVSLRMRHSSPKVTKDHYFTEDQEKLRTDHMYDTPVVEFKKKEQK